MRKGGNEGTRGHTAGAAAAPTHQASPTACVVAATHDPGRRRQQTGEGGGGWGSRRGAQRKRRQPATLEVFLLLPIPSHMGSPPLCGAGKEGIVSVAALYVRISSWWHPFSYCPAPVQTSTPATTQSHRARAPVLVPAAVAARAFLQAARSMRQRRQPSGRRRPCC